MKEEYEKNIFHSWSHARNLKRISGFYGKIVEVQDKEIVKLIEGKNILDVGAGYGLLTKKLQELGYNVVGIEPDPEMVECARKYFSVELLKQSIYNTTFPDDYFDTIILREVLPHLDFQKALLEINRIGKGIVIIFDSAPQPILRLARQIVGHYEYNQRTLNYYLNLLKKNGYNIRVFQFRDVIAFPLSGGYIGPIFLPNINWMEESIIKTDKIINLFLKIMKLQQIFCWRFLAKVQKIKGAL